MITLDNKSEWLEQRFQLTPQATAFISKNVSISFDSLNSRVNLLASLLQSKNINRGTHVSLLFDHSPEFVITLFALWKLNSVPIPINSRSTSIEIEKLYKLSNSSILLVQNSISQNFTFSNEINFHSVSIPDDKHSVRIINSDFQHSDIALIMFTSGTTGNPKGVMLTFDNLYYSASATDILIDQTINDRWLASLPFYHIGGFSIITRALLAGSSIIIPNSLKIENIINTLKKHKPTLASLVPAQLKSLIKTMGNPYSDLRTIFLGGGPIDKNLTDSAIKENWPIVKVYGSTETASMVAAVSFNELKKNFSLGAKPIGDNKIVILDNQKNMIPPERKGEVAVKSKSVMKGYYNNEPATKLKFHEEFYLTSDYGFIDENGYLNIEGRMDNIIISGGENINPKEIEDVLLQHPDVTEAVVFKMQDTKWGEVPVAAVVLRHLGTNTIDKLFVFLRTYLSSFKIPKEIFIVDQIPRNELGKVNKDKLNEVLGLK